MDLTQFAMNSIFRGSIDVADSPGKSNASVVEIIFYPQILLVVIPYDIHIQRHQIGVPKCEAVNGPVMLGAGNLFGHWIQ